MLVRGEWPTAASRREEGFFSHAHLGVLALISVIAAYAIINGVALVVAGVRIHSLTKPVAAA